MKVLKRTREPRRLYLKGKRGRGTALDEKNPIFGMIQHNGSLVLRVVANVKQNTIKPIIETYGEKETQVYTDEYNIYARLEEWGYKHKVVPHGKGEYVWDEDPRRISRSPWQYPRRTLVFTQKLVEST